MEELPKPPEQKELAPPPEEKDLPAPQEKLLNAPQLRKRLNWKGFIIAVIVVALLDWGVMNLLKSDDQQKLPLPMPTPTIVKFSPTPSDPTANWKTFTDNIDGNGFSFQYPSNYSIRKFTTIDNPNSYEIVSPKELKAFNNCIKPKPYVECIKYTIDLQVKIFPKKSTDTLETFLEKQQAEKMYANLEPFKSVIISNHKSMQGQSAGFSTVLNTFIDLDKQIVLISTMSDEEKYSTITNQILSTFKFLDQTASISPKLSCRPRPACLDATPRCMIAESADMCPPSVSNPPLKTCPMLAKLCPDGKTYVTPSGPNCEFAACPHEKPAK